MPTASERARELPPGPELDALFFETCWGWTHLGAHEAWEKDESGEYQPLEPTYNDWIGCPPGLWKTTETIWEPLRIGIVGSGPEYGTVAWMPHVSTDGSACDSWVMRWMRENGICWLIQWCAATVYVPTGDDSDSMSGSRALTEEGENWKHALTRAAIAAKEAMEEKRDG